MRSTWVFGVALCLVVACDDKEPSTATGATGATGGGGTSTGAGAAGGGGDPTGGGGSGGTPNPYGVDVVFPPLASLTYRDSITVRGTADPAAVESLSVAGVAATSGDGFATWSVVVPLGIGDNALDVDLVGMDGEPAVDVLVGNVEVVDLMFATPVELAVDPAGNRMFAYGGVHGHSPASFVTGAVVTIDLATGATTLLSSDFVGNGPMLGSVRGLAWDAAGGRVLAINLARDLIAIDPVNGDRTEVTTDSCSALQGANDVAVDAANGRALVADAANDIVAIDLTTGTCSSLTGNGHALDYLWTIHVDAAGGRAFVAQGTFDSEIVSVDLTSGNRTLVSSGVQGSGPLGFVISAAYDAAGDRLIAPSWPSHILSVDIPTGNRTIASSSHPAMSPVGSGAIIGLVADTVYDPNSARTIIANNESSETLAIDAVTGNRTRVSGFGVGVGPNLIRPRGCAWDIDGDRLFANDERSERVYAISPVSGDRTVLSGPAVGAGPTAGNEALFVDRTRGELLTGGTNSLVAVDLATGDRTQVSGFGVGMGPGFLPRAFALSSDGQSIWIANGSSQILAIDRATGDRAIVSDANNGSGPPLDFIVGLGYDGADLYTVTTDRVLRIDPATGDRAEISGPGVGMGPPISAVASAVLDGTTLYVLGLNNVLAVDVVTGNRTIISQAVDGGPYGGAMAAAVDEHGVIWTADSGLGSAVVIDPTTGERVIASK
jgi:hypothetical protein